MQFSVNHPILYLLAGIIVLAVLAQSLYFLRKAWRRAKEIGMPMDKLRRVAVGTAVFTVAPALAIVISVISLSKKLGIPLPWMRLSVVGAITYETPAAASGDMVDGGLQSTGVQGDAVGFGTEISGEPVPGYGRGGQQENCCKG